MLKTFGITLVFCFFALFGLYISEIQKQKLSNGKKLHQAMLKTKMLLRHWRKDKQKVLNSIEFDYFNKCNLSGKLDAELFSIADTYFNEMGSRDFDSEIESLHLTISAIEARLDLISSKCNQNVKLSLYLGMLVGAFFVIVFI